MQQMDKLLARAKIKLLGNSHAQFLAYAILMMPINFDDTVPTGQTNGVVMKLNPKFFASLSEPERIFLLAHEVYHVLLSHITRRGHRDPYLYNCAADYVINDLLYQQGFTLITGALHDLQYRDMTTEQVYDLLIQQSTSPPSNPMADDIDYQDADDSSASTQASTQQHSVQSQIDSLIARAAMQADMAGAAKSVPDSIRRYLQELHKPKVNWQVVLRRYLLSLDKADYTWRKPRRKLLTHGIYLPSRQSQSLSKISFAIDTSGSISQSQFDAFISEVMAVFKLMKPKQLDVMQFDHRLQYHQTLTSLREFGQIPFKGCGGTCPEVALTAFDETDSKALFVITDGYFYSTDLPKPKRPVIWVIFDNPTFSPPFGKAVYID